MGFYTHADETIFYSHAEETSSLLEHRPDSRNNTTSARLLYVVMQSTGMQSQR